MKKKCKVIMLATEEKGSISINKHGKMFINSFSDTANYNLHIVSDDEIKEGDWMINTNGDTLLKYDSKNEGDNTWREFWRKIIITTDGSIGYTDHRVSPVPNFCAFPQPSQQFIEYFVFEYNRGNVITEVMVEFEDLWIQDYASTPNSPLPPMLNLGTKDLKLNQDNTINIGVVKDSWSRDEVVEKLRDMHLDIVDGNYSKGLNKWIEENL